MKNAVLPLKDRWDGVRRVDFERNDDVKPKQESMREKMPVVTAWIDALRLAFGKEHIDGVISAGVNGGQPVFYASENGHTVGTPAPPGWRVLKDEQGGRTVVLNGNERVDSIQADDGDRRRNQQGVEAWQR
jgi:hypothetical protein